MTATTEPRGGLDLGWDPGEDGWGPAMNANLLRLSRFGFHASVLSMTTAVPPGSPTNGAGYIIPSGASGEWAGKAGQVAVWGGSAWAYAVPRDGWTIHVVDAGLATYEDGVWSQSNAIKPAAIGAEPYAGVPAQTSFWRSTAAGVRAWVQLIAADITDLATTLAGYLPKANPEFTGTLTGPSLFVGTLTGPTLFATEPSGASAVVAWGTGAGPSASVRWKLLKEGTTEAGGNVGSDLVLNSYSDSGSFIEAIFRVPRAASGRVNLYRPLNIAGAFELQQNGATRITAGGDGRFAGLRASEIAGTGTRPLVALSDGTIDDQDASTFRGTIGAAPAPSRATISASTSLGGVSASAIYVPATDVNLTLDGGVDGQAWDIFSTSGFGLAVPSGTSLYAYSGIDMGPTTRNPGGGRAIRIVRLTATTWLAPNMRW